MGQRYAFLDYEGLQRYDQDWLNEFDKMVLTDEEIEDIIDTASNLNVLKYTVIITESKKTGIPFNLYEQYGIVLTVDWGDNTTSTYTSINFPDKMNMNPAIHNYEKAGTYHITIRSNDWKSTYIATSVDNNKTNTVYDIDCGVYWWKKTLYSIDAPLPKFKGIFHISYTITTSNYSSSRSEYIENKTINLYSNSLKNIFSNATYLEIIPYNLFVNFTSTIDFSNGFFNCSSLKIIPEKLFINNIKIENFTSCFSGCSSLESIPENLFINNIKTTQFNGCFSNCTAIKNIPSYLFSNNLSVTNFNYCFQNCTSLLNIPSYLFSNNLKVLSFESCFYNCSSLTSIPSGLFDKGRQTISFAKCFRECSSLTSIPQYLFKYNTKVTSFEYCFYNCSSLTSIPSVLFNTNTAVTDFDYCFNGCTNLTTISSNLFKYNTAVKYFSCCFYECTSINGFTLNIGSSNVLYATNFVTVKSGVTRTVNVPANSTTYTTFNNIKTSLGLTITTS